MKGKFPVKSALFVVLITLIGINIFVFISNAIKGRGASAAVVAPPPDSQPTPRVSAEFYDRPCPELELLAREGLSLNTKNYIGDVLLIRFTRFHELDFPKILFLEHLCNKYKQHGASLIFINLIEKNFPELLISDPDFSSPIIDDDGFLHGIFNARLNDLIIIGRDFQIKFKHNNVNNEAIYRQVTKQLFGDEPAPQDAPSKKWLAIIKKTNFTNIENNKTQNLGDMLGAHDLMLQIFVSLCPDCPVDARISLMKLMASQHENVKQVLLFGRGNDFDLIQKYAQDEGLLSHITVGIIAGVDDPDGSYYDLFDFNVDPRLIILKNNQLRFIEERNSRGKISPEFLADIIDD